MATIQPIFPMEENASIFRICVWFNPPHPPTNTEIILAVKTSLVSVNSLIENTSIRGAIFCHVAIMSPLEKGSPWRTSGNQKWQGASPILKARAAATAREVTVLTGSSTDQDPVTHACISAPFSNRAALMAWIRKYFMVASIFRGENLEHSRGTRARVLVSNPTQIINHFSEVITITVPRAIVNKSSVDIIRCIELGGTLTLNNLIIS